MTRVRVLSITILLLLIMAGFTACVLSFSRREPTPIVTDDFIHTSVYGTLTALFVPSATGTLATPATQPPSLPPNATPQDFIYYYFANINLRNYNLTWGLLTDRFKAHLNGTSQGGFDGYTTFWNTVQQVTVVNAFYTCEEDICAVSTTLTFTNVDKTTKTDVYDYTVVYDHNRSSWMFDFLPPTTQTSTRTFTATLTFTLTSTSTATRTATATSTFTPTFTATYTSTRTGTSTASATFTPSSTLSPTASATPTFSPTSSVTWTPTDTLPPTETGTPTATYTPTSTFPPSEPFTETPTPTETPTNTTAP